MKEDSLNILAHPIDRRTLIRLSGAGGLALAFGLDRITSGSAQSATPSVQTPTIDELVIDLGAEPKTLDPALTYEIDGWSVVYSVYDTLYQYDDNGELQPLLAASLPSVVDPKTYEIKLRPGISFHNGEPFDAKSVAFAVNHILNKDTASQVAGQFAVITEVKEIDPLTIHLVLSQPAPWLPAQMALWLAGLPPKYAAESDFASKPIGTGPYKFVDWKPGESISLEVNTDYFADSPKGSPIAQKLTYRFVSEPSTRVADLLAGTAQIVRSVPIDEEQQVKDGGGQIAAAPVSGSLWVRLPNDVAPFTDVRVRQALNYAVDVDAIRDALFGGYGQRLPNFFAPGGLGYDESLTPYSYDPDKAKSLLAEAGFPDGFDVSLDITVGERQDLADAIAGQLGEIGVKVKIQTQENEAFNAAWKDQNAAPLRVVSWRPLFDPYTLLSLVVSNQGYLSRYNSPTVQPLFDAFSVETDTAKREATAKQLGKALFDDPAAIYLFNLTSVYGIAADIQGWKARTDDAILATVTD
jgi:peptide/nickel transport system substrate-binding protein